MMSNSINPSNFLTGDFSVKQREVTLNEENTKDLIDNYEDELNIRLMEADLSTKKFDDNNLGELI